MMGFLRNLKVTYVITVLALTPMIVAVGVSSVIVAERRQTVTEMHNIGTLVELYLQMGELVHEVQKERGMTAVFLNSKGEKFRTELSGQRKLTDAMRSEFTKRVANLDHAGIDGGFLQKLDQMTVAAASFDTLRASVNAIAIPAEDALRTYTEFNTLVLSGIRDLSRFSSDPKTVEILIGFANFMQARERAGLERAVAAGGLALGRFTPERLERLNELIYQQDTFNQVFLAGATAEERDLFRQIQQDAPAIEVSRIRAIIRQGGAEGDLQGITPAYWFGTITKKINGLLTIDDLVTRNLLATTKANRHTAESSLRTIVIAVGLAILATAGLSAALILSVNRSFRDLVGATLELARGKLDAEIPLRTNNEFGEISKALTVFRDNALDRITAEEKEEEARHDREGAAEHRRAEMDRLQTSLLETVKAANDGNFSERVDADFEVDAYETLARSVNDLLGTVESGLSQVARAVSGLAQGNLDQRMDGSYSGAFLELQRGVNETIGQLHKLVEELNAASKNVYGATQEISDGSTNLSVRAESQATSLEETAAAMEQMAATVKANAENSLKATKLAAQTREQAEHGRSIVVDTVEAMANIRASADEINAIVATIESIAFQTNLLALNAAVEAARAGNAGKGFAVVASEVRTLAQRSSDAAKTIKGLIATSTNHVETGGRLVGETDTALNGILDGVRDVARTIEEIADASKEQTTGIDEVSGAVCQMDELTQQNAILADSSATAARNLIRQSASLVELVEFFTLSGGPGSAGSEQAAANEQRAWDAAAVQSRQDGRLSRQAAPAQTKAANESWVEF